MGFIMFLNPKEFDVIRKEIIDSVREATKDGVVCDYPESFTVTRKVGVDHVTVTFPIWNNGTPITS